MCHGTAAEQNVFNPQQETLQLTSSPTLQLIWNKKSFNNSL